jgi:sulfur-oxidizing protein SoxX
LTLTLSLLAATASADSEEALALMLSKEKGNCVTCHEFEGASQTGNIGPKLANIASKYPDIKQLQTYLWNPLQKNPNTIMPPFGKHSILSEDEIETISKFLQTL